MGAPQLTKKYGTGNAPSTVPENAITTVSVPAPKQPHSHTRRALAGGGGVYLVGNGGSAADAQHWAAELVGRYLTERDPLNVHALTVNSSTFTALVNDYPPEEVFERQVRAHVCEGDLLMAISTSGNSENILLATRAAQDRGARVFGVTGKDGGKLAPLADAAMIAPSSDTPRIQEVHLLFGHLWCELVEQAFTD